MSDLIVETNKRFRNWAQTYECHPSLYFEPKSIDQLREILKSAVSNGKKVKVVGCGHSPSSIACTNDYMISMRSFNKIIDIDANNYQVTVQVGARLDELNKVLYDNNMAFSVLGSISDQTIGGILSTGNHGTGINYGNFNTYITEVEMMLATGEIKTYSRATNSDEFLAVLMSLGCLGILLTCKIQCEKAYKLEQIEFPAKLEDVLESLSVHTKTSDHFRAFWFPHTDYVMCYNATRTDKEPTKRTSNYFKDTLIGYYLLEFLYWFATFIPSIIPTINKFYFKLFSSRKKYVDISYKVFNFDCLFKQYVYEAAIPINETANYLLKLKAWLENNPQVKVHNGVEIRFVKADDIWLSPCYQQDSCYINILMFKPYGKDHEREKYWMANEEIVRECNGRPHWAKSHNHKKEDLMKLYPKFVDFGNLRNKLDPKKIFFNEYLEKLF